MAEDQHTPIKHSRYGVIVGVLFLVLGGMGFWRYGRQHQPPLSPKTPLHQTHCQRWVSLTGAWQRRGLICLQAQGSWRSQLQSAGPRCIFPSSMRLPAHGERLHIARPTPRQPCRFQRQKMTPQQWITLRIPIPLNQADAQALAAIPGLHRRLARRIVAYRRKHGPFEHLEQLTEVRGIGAKTLGRIRPYLTIKRAKD